MENTPCPDRIIDDCGGAFLMGAIGSSIWNFVKGYRNTPKNRVKRFFKLRGSLQAIRQNAPRTGGAFAVWGLTFSTFDCIISKHRKKEDPFNGIASGALTGGVLALKHGRRAIITGTLIGGIFLAMIEGAGILISSKWAKNSHEAEELSLNSKKKSALPNQVPIGEARDYYDENLETEDDFLDMDDRDLISD